MPRERGRVVEDTHERVMAYVAAEMPEDGFVPALVAERAIERLRGAEPELLATWLDERASLILTEVIRTGLRRQRFRARFRGGRRSFQSAVEGQVFDSSHCVSDENLWKHVRDMVGADHRYVADGYMSAARESEMLAAFHYAVAKKVGSKRTEDAMSEAQYVRLMNSIVAKAEGEVA